MKISHKSLNFHTHSLVGMNLRSTKTISEALFRIHDIQGVTVLTKILIEHFAADQRNSCSKCWNYPGIHELDALWEDNVSSVGPRSLYGFQAPALA